MSFPPSDATSARTPGEGFVRASSSAPTTVMRIGGWGR